MPSDEHVIEDAVSFADCVLVVFLGMPSTIHYEGDSLSIRFGPLPVLRKTIRYADITGVETGHTKVIDGWGIHYIPGRGWTYNLWGFGCVKLTRGRKKGRVAVGP